MIGYEDQPYKIRNKLAKDHVDTIREKLKCSSCGLPHSVSPIEFHHDDHLEYPERRVSRLVTYGVSLAEIDLEISKCLPLCRSCHQILDGRLDAMHEGNRKWGEYCLWCNKFYKPLKHGLCETCYYRNLRNNWPSCPIVCRRGHYKLGVNIYVSPKGRRQCKQCKIDRDNRPYYRTEEK